MLRLRLLALLFLAGFAEGSPAERDVAVETLLLRPLADGEILVHLNLSVSTDGNDMRDLELFPRPIAELALASGALEAEFTLSSGRWLSDVWGAMPSPVPPGGSISAAFLPNRWSRGWLALRRSLGALVCASVLDDPADSNAPLDPSRDIVPPDTRRGGGDAVRLRRAVARQSVCTENFAATLGLWPCRDLAGVVAVLGVHSPPASKRVRRARFRALILRFVNESSPISPAAVSAVGPSAAGGSSSSSRLWLHLQLTLVLPREGTDGDFLDGLLSGVLDGAALMRRRCSTTVSAATGGVDGAVARRLPGAGGEGDANEGGSSSRGLRACALASRSVLRVQLPRGEKGGFAFSSLPLRTSERGASRIGQKASEGWDESEWTLDPLTPLPLSLRRAAEAVETPSTLRNRADVQVRRVIARHDDASGLMLLEVINSASFPLLLSCLDSLPVWLQLHWHSMRVYVNSTPADTLSTITQLRIRTPPYRSGAQLAEWDARLNGVLWLVIGQGQGCGRDGEGMEKEVGRGGRGGMGNGVGKELGKELGRGGEGEGWGRYKDRDQDREKERDSDRVGGGGAGWGDLHVACL